MSLAVFRADASANIGGGHVLRCLTLAEELESRGWRCQFLSSDQTAGVFPDLAQRFATSWLSGNPGAAFAERIATGCDLLVVDHYGIGVDELTPCRAECGRLLVIDDLANRRLDADLLLDQNLDGKLGKSRPFVPDSCRILAGPAYALLRPVFAEARKEVLAGRKQSNGGALRLFICLGLTDPGNITGLALKGALQAGLFAAIDVAIGAAAPHLPALRDEFEQAGVCFHIQADAQTSARLMLKADVAIGAPGMSGWERCVMGLPSLLICWADNQRRNEEGLAEAGAAQSLGSASELTLENVVAALTELAASQERRAAMSRRAFGLCDGLGAKRVAEAIDALF